MIGGRVLAGMVGLAFAGPAMAEDALRDGFEGALRGCEAWVLEPATWADRPESFIAEVSLGERFGKVTSVDEAALPPEPLRLANHYWRINSTADSGYILVTSDRLPMCHITGGGQTDLQPMVEVVLGSPEFAARWSAEGEAIQDHGLITTHYRSREDAQFSRVVSRAAAPGGRTDRVQLVATSMFETDN